MVGEELDRHRGVDYRVMREVLSTAILELPTAGLEIFFGRISGMTNVC